MHRHKTLMSTGAVCSVYRRNIIFIRYGGGGNVILVRFCKVLNVSRRDYIDATNRAKIRNQNCSVRSQTI